MKRNMKIATAVAAGALAIGGVLTVGPVTADPGGAAPVAARTMSHDGTAMGGHQARGYDDDATMSHGGTAMGGHQARGYGDDATGMRHHDGPCTGSGLASRGTLTAAQKTTLTGTAEEEKLAHDLYTAFAARYDARVFEHIAAAETGHLTAVRTLLDRYDVTDPTAGHRAGVFTDPAVQATYDRLLKQGQGDLDAALKVGRTVEADDIAALTEALPGLTAPDARQVYTHLLTSSERHQETFDHWIADE